MNEYIGSSEQLQEHSGINAAGKREYNLYNDIQSRTNGEIYIGVVGPVRTGKSTFIKRFMDLMVVPYIEDENIRSRTIDELPQASAGRTIMTTEPKFIPKDAARVRLNDDVELSFRLVDCVGFMVDGATGHIEGEHERPVKTPWFDYEIPFTEAAELGTRKVICDHSTIGIVISSDGSFGDLSRKAYEEAEEKTVLELKRIGKPFIICINSARPYSSEAKELAAILEDKYGVAVMPINCEQLRKDDIIRILEAVLYEFPISEVAFRMPYWVSMLELSHPVVVEVLDTVRAFFNELTVMRKLGELSYEVKESAVVERFKVEKIKMEDGTVDVWLELNDEYYYKILSEWLKLDITDEYQLIHKMRELADGAELFHRFEQAYEEVRSKGYGVVPPLQDEIILSEPELIKHGAKYGVKIHADAPSIHLISANIESEIAPIVGNEEQAADLIRYINSEKSGESSAIKDTLIFGKSIGNLVGDGIEGKLSKMTDECQQKLQDTLKRIINESSAGVIFIII